MASASSVSQLAFESELAAFWDSKLESMNSAKSESIYWSTKLELMNSVKSESLASASALSIAATAPPQVSGTQIAVLNDVADGVANMVSCLLTCWAAEESETIMQAVLVGSASAVAPTPTPTILRLHRRVRERFD